MINPRLHKQLFLDYGAIETKHGLRTTLNKPERISPILRPDRSRGQVTLQSSSTPQWNSQKGLWEWWYWAGYPVARTDERPAGRVELPHYATSTDGLHWETPSLGLYEWQGSTDNNIAPAPGGMKMYHVLRDEHDDDPQRRYKGMFAGPGGNGRYPAVSPDGFDWTLIDTSPIPSRDTSHLTYDETTGQFLATVKLLTEWGRSFWLSTSHDFVDWTDACLLIETDEIDRNNRVRRVLAVADDPGYLTPPAVDNERYMAEIYKMSVMPYEGLYIGLPVLFNPSARWRTHNHFGINQTEVAVSRDLCTWHRVANRDLFLDVQPWDGVRYDTAQLLPCGRPIVRQDLGEIWVYYNTCRFRARREDVAEEHRHYFDEDLNAVALAKVRLDGFVSLDALKNGTMTSKPFLLDGGDLRINVDATNGELRAAVLDAETMQPLPGSSLTDSDPIHTDDLNARLTWNGTSPPSHDRPIRLRFDITTAKLYAFWLAD